MKFSAAFTSLTNNQGFSDKPHAYNVFVHFLKNRFTDLAGSGLNLVASCRSFTALQHEHVGSVA